MTKYIDIKEFRTKGYLQELNRNFLHPLGLALEVKINDSGNEILGGVWDYRNDNEGIYYDLAKSDDVRKISFMNKRIFIKNELAIRKEKRTKKLGFFIEPIEK